jgi:hypothetical protein
MCVVDLVCGGTYRFIYSFFDMERNQEQRTEIKRAQFLNEWTDRLKGSMTLKLA